MRHQIENLLVDGNKMEVFIFEPQGEGPFPALMQCMHIPVGHTGIENLDAAFKMLSEKNNVDSDRIGIFEHCWGGRVSWLGAATNPNYKACAVFYGGRIKKIMGENNPPVIDLAQGLIAQLLVFLGMRMKIHTSQQTNKTLNKYCHLPTL